MTRLRIFTYLVFLFILLPASVSAQYSSHRFRCAWIGPAEHPCTISWEECDGVVAYNSWEQQYCDLFANDPVGCQGAYTCCHEIASICAGPTPTNLPNQPTATPGIAPTTPPLPPTPTPAGTLCYACYTTGGANFWCAPHTLDSVTHTCLYYQDEGKCQLDCAEKGGPDPNAKWLCNCNEPHPFYCKLSPLGTLNGSECDTCLFSCLEKKEPIFCTGSGVASVLPSEFINTGLGCISYQGKTTIQTLLNWAVGLSGGISLLFIALAGIQITFSFGDPAKIRAGKELLTSALLGLGLIILCVVVLNLIGVTVLGLPHFNL